MTGASSVVDIDLGKENKKPADQRVFPLFIFKSADNKTYNILYTRGKGLWDEIWGYITLDSDLNTIAGQAFDHKGETPGLGAEIKDNKSWYTQFTGKKLYNEAGEYKSVAVVKGGVKIKITKSMRFREPQLLVMVWMICWTRVWHIMSRTLKRIKSRTTK